MQLLSLLIAGPAVVWPEEAAVIGRRHGNHGDRRRVALDPLLILARFRGLDAEALILVVEPEPPVRPAQRRRALGDRILDPWRRRRVGGWPRRASAQEHGQPESSAHHAADSSS